MSVANTVKKRLTMMNFVIAITSVIGVISIWELSNGMHLHELNFAHYDYSAKLATRLETADLEASVDRQDLKALVSDIRDQPIACLKQHDMLTALSTKFLGTYQAFIVCQEDLVIADRALEILNSLDNGHPSLEAARLELHQISQQFVDHSHQFSPLVSKTVSALLIFSLFVMFIKGGLVVVVSLVSSRSILKQFARSQKMEERLCAKNAELGNSISVLEKQKLEINTAKQMAEHHSLHDPLTNLPNRRFLDRKMKQFDDRNKKVALLHIDIDHFKQINDTKGHDAGDYILVHVANMLQELVRGRDFVARVGGDEFVVLANLTEREDPRVQAVTLAERINKIMSQPVSYENEPCRLSVSIGVANKLDDTVDMKTLFVNADTALYRAKLEGRNRFDIYDETLKNDVMQRKSLADELIIAVERQQIIPFYQLQFETQTLAVSGMEALARWEHPSKGVVSPAEFLPIAQELGILGEIDQLIMNRAVKDLNGLDVAGLQVPRVSINISAQRLNEQNFLEDIKALNLPADRISFELLESIFLDNAEDKLRWTIDGIHDLGIDLEIDDFGSGHASILALLDVKPRRFKIDRQVIRNIHESRSTRSLVRSIVGIGNSLDMEVVAEGIETVQHVAEIQKTECAHLQGYALAMPMSIENLHGFLREKSWLNIAA
ncbi:MAG: EAL domain-containing protein [Hyphomicrobiales bacterium]